MQYSLGSFEIGEERYLVVITGTPGANLQTCLIQVYGPDALRVHIKARELRIDPADLANVSFKDTNKQDVQLPEGYSFKFEIL